jgi:hypothetical protein
MAAGISPSAPAGVGRVVLRVLAIVLGGYAASAALVAAASATLPLFGMARMDAYTISGMLGFLVYLGLGLWAAAERRLVLLVVTLVGLTAAGAAIAGLVMLGGA